MPRARRTRYLLFRCADRELLDLDALLRGAARFEREPELRAVSVLDGAEHPLTRPELDLLLSLPVDRYVDVDDRIVGLAERGLVVLEDGDGSFATHRHRDHALANAQWNLYAALYHSMTRWRDLDAALEAGREIDEHLRGEPLRTFIDRYGSPPPTFHKVPAQLGVHELPVIRGAGGLYDALARRRTCRRFDRSDPVREDELSLVLRETYGAHGYARLEDDVSAIRRTSPSGGGLHPIEAYPLVIDVDGIDSGLYHYDVERHALVLIERLSRADAEQLASAFTAGQEYFRDASVHVVLAARFYRSYWKYRRHERAYAVLLMDAAHLSQTFYLVCADLGLGAFVTAAINSENVDQRLGLDGFAQGALLISGCGRPAGGRSVLEPEFEPYVPREADA